MIEILKKTVRCIAFALTFIALTKAQPNEVVLHNFGSIGPKGQTPQAGVTRDAAGNLYGTTEHGGVGDTEGYGVVYKLDAAGETVLHQFTGGSDGASPQAGVTLDGAGNLYGTTAFGGISNADGFGVVYKVDSAGNETVLHSFTGPDGALPQAGVILDRSGNLYGTTSEGGTAAGVAGGAGVVFKLDTAGTFTVLHSFTGGVDGEYPMAGLSFDTAGNLYGTASRGGQKGYGVVFEIKASGQFSVLHSFAGGDGASPHGGVVLDAEGNLYGTTHSGGANFYGVVFKLTMAGQYTILYTFGIGGGNGGSPDAGVILDRAGNLYGTTNLGGQNNYGVVYKLDATGQ